jgi:hypothetical protein
VIAEIVVPDISVGEVVAGILVAAAVVMAVEMAVAVAMAMVVAEPKVRQWVVGGSRLHGHQPTAGRGNMRPTRNLS